MRNVKIIINCNNKCNKVRVENDPTTFELVEEGDLVYESIDGRENIKRVDSIVEEWNGFTKISVVNSRGDTSYINESGIKEFNKRWKLLCKAENLLK